MAWLPKMESDLSSVLLPLIEELFVRPDCHRLTWVPRNLSPEARLQLSQLGFHIDGLLRHAVPHQLAYEDAMLYSLLRSDWPGRDLAFVPFKAGIATLEVKNNEIVAVDFLHYGEQLQAGWLFDKAWEAGLATAEGRIHERRGLTQALLEAPGATRPQPEILRQAKRQLRDYFLGRRESFNIPYRFPEGTEFQKKIWSIVEQIPYGETRSYQEVALAYLQANQSQSQCQNALALLDSQQKEARQLARAVGRACGQNPLPLLIPCHRVIGQDHRLTGFSAGIQIKAALLDLEFLARNQRLRQKNAQSKFDRPGAAPTSALKQAIYPAL